MSWIVILVMMSDLRANNLFRNEFSWKFKILFRYKSSLTNWICMRILFRIIKRLPRNISNVFFFSPLRRRGSFSLTWTSYKWPMIYKSDIVVSGYRLTLNLYLFMVVLSILKNLLYLLLLISINVCLIHIFFLYPWQLSLLLMTNSFYLHFGELYLMF